VPAAAVIPAPRAYTNIAAVKTLVVCHWVAGLPGGQRVLWSVVYSVYVHALLGRWNTTPGSMLLHPLPMMVRSAPAQSLLHWRPEAALQPQACVEFKGQWPCALGKPSPPPESTINDTLENSVCSKHPAWLNACPWNVKASTKPGHGVVQALEPVTENVVLHPGLGQTSLRAWTLDQLGVAVAYRR